MNNNHFKNDAKQLVDTLFDIKFIREDVTRDDMNEVEGLIHFILKSKFNSYLKSQKLLESLQKIKK